MDNLVFSNMLHRPARTFVSVLGIGIGVFLIFFTIGLANGSIRDKAAREANVGAEIMFCSAGSYCLSNAGSLRLPISLVGEIEKTEGVTLAVPLGQNTVSAGDNDFGTRLLDGINFDQYAQITGLKVIEGRKFTDGADEIMTDTAWLPQKKLKIGDSLNIYDRKFTIVGTYEPSGGSRVKIPLTTMQKQIGAENKVSTILIKIKDGFTAEQIAKNLEAKFPEGQTIPTSQLEELYMQSIPALDIFLNVVVGVAGTVSALIILLTMYTTVTERTRQIGVLKSLGMSNLKIALIIVQEAVLMSVVGIIIGILLTFIMKAVLLQRSTLKVLIEPKTIVLILFVGLFSGIVGALYPALRAARLDAVDALGYE